MVLQIDRPPAADAVIECRGLGVVKGGKHVVRGIDWTVGADERWVVIGANGAGKSSLLDVVSARAHPTSGQVRLLGEQLGAVDVFDLRARIGVIGPSVASSIPAGERVEDAVLTGANLNGARLDGANLLGADFTGANLGTATLAGARIDGARFTDAKLDSTIWVDRRRCRPGSVGECR